MFISNNKKKVLILLLCCALLISCFFVLFGCFFNRENPFPYRGEYKELYTVAVYSIPDAVGYMHFGEGARNSDIYVWEQDDYGRTLFSYCEDDDNQIFGLVISQSYDENNVYFYPDINYALTFIDSEYYDYLKNKTEAFYLEAKDKLKEKNDWNKPLDKNKCVCYPITDHKILDENIYSLNKDQCNEILIEYINTLNFVNPTSNPYRYGSILQVDSEGRVLHEIHGCNTYYDKTEWNRWDPDAKDFTFYNMILWVITDKDGNYDKKNGVMVMYSKANESDNSFIYNPDDILEFKNQNNWATLYCGE